MIIAFTNIVFACALESAPSPAGPWTEITRERTTCAQAHAFEVEPAKRAEFFRLRLLDNGLVPTPDKPHAFVRGNAVLLDCPLVFNCADDPMSFYRWYRDGAAIGESRTSGFTDYPPAGVHRYQAVAVDGGLESWPTEEITP